MTNRWKNLVEVTSLQYEQERQNLALYLKKEQKLRADLAKLTAFDHGTRHQKHAISGLKAIGADVVWNTWLAQSRTRLNAELAQVLALKEQRMHRIRKAHARFNVTQKMRDRIAQEKLIAEEKTRIGAILEQIATNEWRS